jgi:hypothetical protein
VNRASWLPGVGRTRRTMSRTGFASFSPYLRRLKEICTAEHVSMVCFGSDIEMRRVAPHLGDIERATGARFGKAESEGRLRMKVSSPRRGCIV